jgi:hypothetical protein
MKKKLELGTTAHYLSTIMSDISQEYYCAGWLGGLEYYLWDAITNGVTETFRLADERKKALLTLSKKCKGWVVYNDKSYNREFVSLKRWNQLFSKWKNT